MKRGIFLFLLVVGFVRADFDFVTAVTLQGRTYTDRSGVGTRIINTCGAPITITQLGLYKTSGNSQTHLVGIYTSTSFSSPAASVTVDLSTGTAGTFVYGTLETPYVLANGATIYIMASYTIGSGDAWQGPNAGLSPVLTTPGIASTSSAATSGSTIVLFGNSGGTYTAWGPVSFRFSSPDIPGWTKAGTTYTTNGYPYAVNSAILDSTPGDRINVPAGTFTWGGGANGIYVNKAVTLAGAGPASTIINISSSTPTYANGGAVNITANATFTGFDMVQPGTGNTTAIHVSGASVTSPRITEVTYHSAPTHGYFLYASNPSGLMDHCTVYGSGGNDEWIFVRGPDDSWQTPSSYGSGNVWFFEDNTLKRIGYFDFNANARGVVRFNEFNEIIGNMKIDGHGDDSNSPPRSFREMEAYGNVFRSGTSQAFEIRGGSGMFFDNVAASTSAAFSFRDYSYLNNLNPYGRWATAFDYPLTDQVGLGEDPPVAGSQPAYIWSNFANNAAWARTVAPIGTASAWLTNTAGYSIGATSITLASRTFGGSANGRIQVNDAVAFSGDNNRYVVTSGLASGATSGTITIAAPGLLQAIPASATAMTSGPLTKYQQQMGSSSATFDERDVIRSNRDLYADAGFDTNTGVTVGLTPTGTPTNKYGYFATGEGTWNRTFSGTQNATSIQAGWICEIVSVGSTDFTLIGARANSVGVVFKATGAGSGSGTVKPRQGRLYIGNGSDWVLSYEPYQYPHPLQSAAPVLGSATINSTGTTLTLNFSRSCTTGAGGNGGVSVSATGGAVTPTYSTGSGSTTYVYTLNRVINASEAVTVSYVQPGNGIEATDDQTDVASFTDQAVENGSLVNGARAASVRPTAAISGGF